MQNKIAPLATEPPKATPPSLFERARKLLLKSRGSDQPVGTTGKEPQVLLAKFHSLQGGAKTAFFRANREALKAADAAAPPSSIGTDKAIPVSRGKHAGASSPNGPEALLERFHSLQGATKTAFFRANKSLLKAAANLVDARESNDEDRAIRAFAVAQSQAIQTPSIESLVASFESLHGAAKTAFFRANHAALRLAAAAAN